MSIHSEITKFNCPRCNEKTIQIFSRGDGLHVVNAGGKKKLRKYPSRHRLLTSCCSNCGLKGTKLRKKLKGEGII